MEIILMTFVKKILIWVKLSILGLKMAHPDLHTERGQMVHQSLY